MELVTSSHPPIPHTLLTDVIATFTQPILPFSGPTMSPGSFLRFWRYINPSLTFVLIYLLILWLYSKWTIEICLIALLKWRYTRVTLPNALDVVARRVFVTDNRYCQSCDSGSTG